MPIRLKLTVAESIYLIVLSILIPLLCALISYVLGDLNITPEYANDIITISSIFWGFWAYLVQEDPPRKKGGFILNRTSYPFHL